MGWRNSFIKIKKSKDIKKVEEFVDHHNNWTSYFTEKEVDKMIEDDEVPGEKLTFDFIYDKKNDVYWAYLGNHGGMSWTFSWQEKYFPKLKIFCSSDWPHYDEEDEEFGHWTNWPMYSVEQYKQIIKNESKTDCKKI